MNEQFGPIYIQPSSEINAPSNTTYYRMFINTADNLVYVKKHDGSIELLADFVGTAGIIPLTYNQLLAKATASELIIGGNYLITDFRTRYTIPNTATVAFGGIEPIIVIASNVNTIHVDAASTLFPEDNISYELIDSTTSGGDRGRIYLRIDTLTNVQASYNWRVIKFRRWETAPLSGIFTVLTNNGGTFQDYFTFNNSASAANCFNTFIGEITQFGINTFNAPTSKLNNNIFNAICYDNKVDVDSFDNTINSDTFGGNVILPAFIGNTQTGGQFTINTIGPAFIQNLIGSDFTENNLKFQFAGNVVGNTFAQNVIDSTFAGNIIQDSFERNVIGQAFAQNVINNTFQDNIVGSEMQGNNIGNDFSVNQIFTKFQNNAILNSFRSNIIQGAFSGNINIKDFFQRNDIDQGLGGIDFNLATHVYGDYDKDIFKNSAGVYRLSYVDGADTVIYTAPNA